MEIILKYRNLSHADGLYVAAFCKMAPSSVGVIKSDTLVLV